MVRMIFTLSILVLFVVSAAAYNRVIFFANINHNGDFGGLGGADSLCQAIASGGTVRNAFVLFYCSLF